MIRSSLKNFAKNLVYLFIPMGIFYLFLLLTVFGLAHFLIGGLSTMLSDLTSLIHVSVEDSSVSVNEFLKYAFGQIEWTGNYAAAIRQIFSTAWLKNTAMGFLETLNASTENFGENFSAIVLKFKDTLVAGVSVAAVICAIGVVLANFAARFAIRRKTARRNFKKFFLAHTVVPIVQAIILIAFYILFAFIRFYSLLALVVLLALSAVLSLTASWVVHSDKTVKLKEVLTLKNILSYLGSVGLIILLDLALAAALFAFDALIAALLMVPIVIYSFCIADVNTDAFVCSLVEKNAAPAAA